MPMPTLAEQCAELTSGNLSPGEIIEIIAQALDCAFDGEGLPNMRACQRLIDLIDAHIDSWVK